MKQVLAAAVILALVSAGSAHDITDVSRPEKTPTIHPQNVPGPRQGGDTILDAVPIDLPAANLTGTTAGFNDDYDETCPYDSSSPEVVYTFTPTFAMGLDIDMLGSAYDTKIYVYDEDLVLVACNDDFYPDWVSYLEDVPVAAGVPYYLVIDGYGGASGDYLLNISEHVPCVIDCPSWADIEGEPPIVDGYVDNFNGGCNSTPEVYSQVEGWASAYCGKLGYFLDPGGLESRDLDWHEMVVPHTGFIEIWGDAEEAMNLYQIEGDCDNLVIQNGGVAGPCSPFSFSIFGEPGETVRLLCGATHFWEGETYEYDYTLIIGPYPVATEQHSWSSVKSLFE